MKPNLRRRLGIVALMALLLAACDIGTDPESDEAARDGAQDEVDPEPHREDLAPEADPHEGAPEGWLADSDAEIQRFDGPFLDTSTLAGTIEPTDERAFIGEQSMAATAQSSRGYAFSRVQETVWWEEGDEIWYGGAIYLEPGFNQAQGDGSVDILRWDNWQEHPDEADHGGLALLSDGRLGLISESAGNSPWSLLLGPFDMPEGEWVWLEVGQRFSATDGQAWNEVWMDGEQLGTSDAANYFGRPISRFRVGIIGTPDPQPGELRLYIDHAATARTGPIVSPR